MKKFIFIVYFISMCFIGRAQKISDSYFKEREKYWVDYNSNIQKNGFARDSTFQNFVKNGGEKEKLVFRHIFSEYEKVSGKNLDTAKSIFLLQKRTHSRHSFVIWNALDTIYISFKSSPTFYKNLDEIKIHQFNDEINTEKDYLIAIMNMVSKVKVENIQQAIDEKTLDKNGKIRLILDGSSFQLYFFNKKSGNYEVEKFAFSNPKLNE